MGGKLYASQLGLLSERPPFLRVVPLSGRYIPKAGDVVIGTVTDVQTTFWLLDIGAPRWAPLHMTGAPWKVEIGETDRYLGVGDSVVVQVENLEATGRIGVTMIGEGLGKLDGGTLVRISPARIPRLVGRGGSMIQTITQQTGAHVAIGQNGRVWVDGSPEAIRRVTDVLRMIEENGQRSGLTSRVESYLLATTPTASAGAPIGHPPEGEPPEPAVDPAGIGEGSGVDDDDAAFGPPEDE